MVEVPKFSMLGGTVTEVRVFGSTPAPVQSPREVGSMMAREIIEFTRLALRRGVELEELLDWRPLVPDFPAPPSLPAWMPPPPATDPEWVRDYVRGLAATLDRAAGPVAETPAVVEAFDRATRVLRIPQAA
ncbi:MAG: hypothetical protein RJA49_577 [Actinomycetota bacterium]